MGPLLPDSGNDWEGGTRATDVVLLDGPADLYCDNGAIHQIGPREFAETIPLRQSNATSPGVMLLDGSDLASAEFESTFVHELFHAFQLAHSARLINAVPGNSHWTYEATAVWAELHYAPHLTRTWNGRSVHNIQNNVDDGLNDHN